MINKRRSIFTLAAIAIVLAGGALAWTSAKGPAAQQAATMAKPERALELIPA